MKNKRKIESEINYKALIKKPIRLFGLVYIYFFVVALAIGLYYLNVMDTSSFNTVPGTSLDTLNIVREINTKVGGIKPAMDLGLITNPTANLIASGKKQYEAVCASCHGIEGKGDGVAAVALNPKPRNFHSADGWTNGRTFYDIYTTVNNGVPGTGMTAYEFISPEERVAIIQYIRTFADYPKVTEAEVKDKLDATYKLSAGVVDPNNIPIQKAITLISDENQKSIDLAVSISQKIEADSGDNAILFKNNVQNIEKAVYVYLTKLDKIDYNSFAQAIVADPVALGYRASVINLLDKDLQSIYLYLKRISG
ncbi:MAG: cytochrome c [Bacteroidetes bacterium]|nr:cytochrome c [Bacteroidota bacterium]MBU1114443.1 cytochrome c [Bacteroidota bacterium]MBU1799791.1 cytochrome c [Bacteroidota bacterium]